MFARVLLGCVLVAAITLCAASGERLAPTPNIQEKNEKKAVREPRVVEVSVRLNKQEATPGEVIRITELVPADREVVVAGTGHSVCRIGDYNQKLDRLVLREVDRYLHAVTFTIFDGLPSAESGSGAKDITVKNPREQGFEIEFKPKKLGMYLIEANWTLKNGAELYGQPVIITVKPPRDDKGQPIIKHEWLPR